MIETLLSVAVQDAIANHRNPYGDERVREAIDINLEILPKDQILMFLDSHVEAVING